LSRFEIRPERLSDYKHVYQIQRAAFGQDGEARLVEALRKRATPHLSLVAEMGEDLVGHVMFSPVSIEGAGEPPPIAGLAPLAVLPERQGEGAGSALIRAGLSDCDSMGWQAIFLLGDPAYYSRFGFNLAAARGLRYESEAFDVAFQFIELVPDALSGCRGWVRYHEAFSELA
jgi:putative acetyltransferase